VLPPAAAIFPPITEGELQALADDIEKNGQRHDIVQHPDGSILDGLNRQPGVQLDQKIVDVKQRQGRIGADNRRRDIDQQLIGQRMTIHTKNGPIPAVISSTQSSMALYVQAP
jgi:hypothetical protein